MSEQLAVRAFVSSADCPWGNPGESIVYDMRNHPEVTFYLCYVPPSCPCILGKLPSVSRR